MKKVLFSAVLVAAVIISFGSCEKKVVKQNPGSADTGGPVIEKTVCTLSNAYGPDYLTLGSNLFGNLDGQGTTGPIDTYLNCNQSAGTLCNMVTATGIPIISLSSDPSQGWDVLSDGVMTITEQQSLVSQIQMVCNNHKNSAYGSNYIITNYDVFFTWALCGGCPEEIIVMVTYKAGKPCR